MVTMPTITTTMMKKRKKWMISSRTFKMTSMKWTKEKLVEFMPRARPFVVVGRTNFKTNKDLVVIRTVTGM
jgi:hypothetical protein